MYESSVNGPVPTSAVPSARSAYGTASVAAPTMPRPTAAVALGKAAFGVAKCTSTVSSSTATVSW